MGARGAPLATRELPAILDRVDAALAARRESIDDLNVFPVPDGDTGTNMLLTVRAGRDALREAAPRSGRVASKVVTRGVLRGARGNSGVILSQVLRAMVEVVTGHREVDAGLYAAALARARDLAYEAVAEPVEGTILSAISAAAEAGEAAVGDGLDLVATSAAVCERVADAVERTPEQLPVLADAGVVDAGARGLHVLLAAFHGHLTGEDPAVREDVPPPGHRDAQGGCIADLAHPFEVQYLLDAKDKVAAPLRHQLEAIGDSVVVVAAGGLLAVHVHTGDVGAAIEVGLDHGRPSRIEVVHFGDQVAAQAADEQRDDALAAAPPLGAVVVLDGGGITALARSLGALVVPGAAGSLPSVAELLDAVTSAPATRVVLLPGHRNAVPTAHQAATLARDDGDHRVAVVDEATSPPACLAALAVLDPDGDPQQVVADARAAAAHVRVGAVTLASRSAKTPVGPVRRGQPLAVVDGDVVAVCEDPVAALRRVAEIVGAERAEVVSLHLGAAVEDDEREQAEAVLATVTDAEVDVLDAGQRPVRYWLGAE
jgi:uncharacterized protein